MSLPIQITVGAGGLNPVAGSSEYNNPALEGIAGYVVKEGYGIWGYENYQLLSGGGFRLLNGYLFETGANYFFVPVTAVFDNESVSGYTNGFNFNQVVSALLGRVGWLQTAGPVLDSNNLISRSGRRFNDGSFHPLVTLNNIKDIMDLPNASDEQFNAHLSATTRAIILRSLNGVFNEPEYISESLLYDRWGMSASDTPINNTGKFVGFQIKLPSKVDLATQINSLGLLFDGVATFNIYVYNDIKQQPIYTKEVTTVANTQTVVELPDFVLNYIGANNHGGVFYVGYYQEDLGSVKAIRENNVSFKCNAPYAIVPFEAKVNASIFEKTTAAYGLNTYGINPHITVFRDHTWQIVKNPALFDNLIGLQMAAQVAEASRWTMRSNSTERKLNEVADKVQLGLDLDGVAPISDSPRTTGLRQQIQQETKRIKQSFLPKAKSIVLNAEYN